MLLFNLTNRDGDQSLSVNAIDGSFSKIVPANHPYFAEIVAALVKNPQDEEHIKGLVDPTVGIGKQMAEITDRVTWDSRTLFFDGQPLHATLAKHIHDKISAQDADWKRLIRFMLNLDENPSFQSQGHLYEYISKHGLTITEDGCFVAYKGVKQDGTSATPGPWCQVDGEFISEDPSDSVHVPNEVGTVVSIQRKRVDDDIRHECSYGLHVGAHSYASTFGGHNNRLLTVKVNPRDAVAVPRDHYSAKIRVSAYEVLEISPKREDLVGTTTGATSYAPTLDTVEKQVTWLADNNNRMLSMSHDFGAGEQEEYDSLVVGGRTLYDNLRTQFHHDHATAYSAAYDVFGSKYPVVEEEQETVEEEQETVEVALVQPTSGSGLIGQITLNDWVRVNPNSLGRDLYDTSKGHKEIARLYPVTTESSVRRFRKKNNIA